MGNACLDTKETIDGGCESARLRDRNPRTGRDRDWAGRKTAGMDLALTYSRLGWVGRAERVTHCGDVLQFNECPKEHEKHLVRANFCRDPLCPVCVWRRSRKLGGQLREIADEARSEVPGIRLIHLVLTVRNAQSEEELNATLDALTEGFARLRKRKRFRAAVLGHFRAVEITIGATGDHSHLHVLLAVDSSYFAHTGLYIDQAEWVQLWRECVRLNYDPSVHVQAIRRHDLKALAEITKYVVKGSEWIADDERVRVLASAVKSRRMVEFGGLFRDIKRRLRLEDAEAADADLVGAEGVQTCCATCGAELVEIRYIYDVGMCDYRRDAGAAIRSDEWWREFRGS